MYTLLIQIKFLKTACLIEPYAVGVEINSRASHFRKDKVVVFGSGPAGLAVMQVARARGGRSFDY
ncbi:hypothetical protein INT80_04030 [Gallibacterium anatis]|uniref:Uncharacterized protein n=1 Tax=Gallibacterium anatis TaxID=750 RepID=A0A930UVM6_9PAST|nr:hypothetical protein [Gallibacterium anatis]